MEIFLSFIFLIIGFGLLIFGANYFVDSSSRVAKKLGVSQLFIALTIVAMGTSIPETAVSLLAAIKGNPELSVGNIVGTNTLNILLILGITSVILPLTASRSTVMFEIPIMVVTAIVYTVLGFGFSRLNGKDNVTGYFSRIDGVILLILFFWYLVYLRTLAKRTKTPNALVVVEKKISWFELISILVVGLGMVIAGSALTVKGASKLATILGISERIIGITVVAFGTSLPELATSVVAVIKKQDDIAVGNIVGSNIYNMLFIGGLTALIHPISFGMEFLLDGIICIVSSLLLQALLINRQSTLYRWSGGIMLFCYLLYLIFIILNR